jgi:carbon monoxide dehydrogenase subunit G
MPTFTLTRAIQASQQIVWNIITDIEGSPAVTPAITRIQMLTEGLFRVGSRWNETRKMGSREATVALEVTECTPPRSYTVRSTLMGMEFLSQFQVVPQGGDTRLDLVVTSRPVNLGGRVVNLLSPLMAGAMRKDIQRDMDAIKRTAEARQQS